MKNIAQLLMLLCAHLSSRAAQKEMEDNPYVKYAGVPLDYQAGWEACNVRNLTGYAGLGIGGIALSIGIVAARAGLIGF